LSVDTAQRGFLARFSPFATRCCSKPQRRAVPDALLYIARVVGAPGEDHRRIRMWIGVGRRGLEQARDPSTGLARDYDLRAERWLSGGTVAGFARGPHRDELVRRLQSDAFAGHPRLRWPVPPSIGPLDPAFDPRRYWRGPDLARHHLAAVRFGVHSEVAEH
jgi:hypothetical protein